MSATGATTVFTDGGLFIEFGSVWASGCVSIVVVPIELCVFPFGGAAEVFEEFAGFRLSQFPIVTSGDVFRVRLFTSGNVFLWRSNKAGVVSRKGFDAVLR